MRARSREETTRLLPDNLNENRSLRATWSQFKEPLKVTLDRYTQAITSLSIPLAIAYPFDAYPGEAPAANRFATFIGLPLCVAGLALSVATDRKRTVKGRNVSDISEVVEQVKTGANTANFFLGFYIAAYIAVDAIIKHLGKDDPVKISDGKFVTAFILPSLMLGVAHSVLEMTKKSWIQSTSIKAKVASAMHTSADTLYKASNLNEVMLFALGFAHIKEKGAVDPYERLGLFLTPLMLGIFMQVLNNRYQNLREPTNRLLELTASANYFGRIFYQEDAKDFSKQDRYAMITIFSMLAVASAMSTYYLPKKAEVVWPWQDIEASAISLTDISEASAASLTDTSEVPVVSLTDTSEVSEVSLTDTNEAPALSLTRISGTVFAGRRHSFSDHAEEARETNVAAVKRTSSY